MITVTNKIRQFFEEDSPIIIFGAGKSGYWVGHYMDLCHIDYDYYVDSSVSKSGLCQVNDHFVYNIQKLVDDSRGKRIRVIVAASKYESILANLLFLDSDNKLDLFCLVPKYKRVTPDAGEGYTINRLLGYFRRKLLHGELPSIISSDCVSGYIYEMFDSVIRSPLINTSINPTDFLKICNDPFKYLDSSIEKITWEKNPFLSGWECPVGHIKDIRIVFAHDRFITNDNILIERWDSMKQLIDWDHMVFLLSDNFESDRTVTKEILDDFEAIKYPHIVMNVHGADNVYYVGQSEYLWFDKPFFFTTSDAIENHFDILSWMNRIIDSYNL